MIAIESERYFFHRNFCPFWLLHEKFNRSYYYQAEIGMKYYQFGLMNFIVIDIDRLLLRFDWTETYLSKIASIILLSLFFCIRFMHCLVVEQEFVVSRSMCGQLVLSRTLSMVSYQVKRSAKSIKTCKLDFSIFIWFISHRTLYIESRKNAHANFSGNCWKLHTIKSINVV